MRKTIVWVIVFATIGIGLFYAGKSVPSAIPEDNGFFLGLRPDLDIDLEDVRGIPLGGVIIDDALALEIANAVIVSVYGEKMIQKTEYYVYELEGKNLFVVCRVPKGGESLDGDVNVAISKFDGGIVKVWAGG